MARRENTSREQRLSILSVADVNFALAVTLALFYLGGKPKNALDVAVTALAKSGKFIPLSLAKNRAV